MTTVTTTAEINRKILSLDYTSFRVEILSADAQPSYKDGVMVVVTGCLTGRDNLKRKFTQSFFLAPQDEGFFVFNDAFRHVDEYKSVDIDSVPANDAEESVPTDDFTSEPEPNQVPEHIPPSQPAIVDTNTNVSKEVSQPLENGKVSVTENVVPVNHVKESSHQEHNSSTDKAASNTQEDAPKKSFAFIVNALKDNAAPFHVRTSPVKPVEQPRVTSVPASEAPAPSTGRPLEKNNENGGKKAYAIFVANFPMNATVEQLGSCFPFQQQGSCFGFVEFESVTSMQSALEPIMIVSNIHLDEVDTEMTEMITSGAVATYEASILRFFFPTIRYTYRERIANVLYRIGELMVVSRTYLERIENAASDSVLHRATLVAVVVAMLVGMILRSEVISLADLEVAIIMGVAAMDKLCQGVIIRMEEKSLVNQLKFNKLLPFVGN